MIRFLTVFTIINGAIINAGILITINMVWNDANIDIVVVPALNPKIVAIRLPAQVGQPINNPHVAPRLPIILDFLYLLSFSFNLFIINIFSEILKPTKKETMNNNAILIGIRKIKKYSVK